MITDDELVRYQKVNVIRDTGGYITWRRGTGDNVELLHIRSTIPRSGIGEKLLKQMLKELLNDPPYATVFGFTRVSNHTAQNFYVAMGFVLTPVNGVYADGEAVLFSQTFKELVRIHNVS